mmetsp:Transcript_42442/g.83277  ORF Transcript_42442/g.83277 Transcript_42442/m.83277 type:complete len:388 (-) Transcript_42442:152-1315(-)|eukprot:CAMPEP_0175131286 /NCGR_PEP_ID=MMETSP0087-20121206/6459_1 /TAXON_ID=136419 /ORGANISM="Unknown Unknown, Strain D1" /LENGTH=387 /DNA_ID=CAMNT_0016413561 /DNA_START=15 /DNA_END=1178 /DNA_ORIENTATION=-
MSSLFAGGQRGGLLLLPKLTTRKTRKFSLLAKQINDYTRRPQQNLVLRDIIEVSLAPTPEVQLQNSQFLYKELPIRLAKRTKELDSLPYGLSLTEPVLKVKSWYAQSFRDILSQREPKDNNDLQAFTSVLHDILNRHSNVVPTMAQGVLELRKEFGSSDFVKECPFLQDFLDRFYMSRIGLRLLIMQHIAMMKPKQNYAGTIALQLSPVEVAQEAIADATRICEKTYGVAPDVEIFGHGGTPEDIRISFVPTHLHHMLHEILKNAMRATVETYGTSCYDLPPVHIVFADGEEDWSIKVSDQGGGIKRADLDKVWSYLHTTANRPGQDFFGSHGLAAAPMAGLGYGLPLSRLFAQYFGGDLQMVSMEGYGTDVYLYLHKLTDFDLFLD